MIPIVYRGIPQKANLIVTLHSDESLGLLNTAYVEDYDGNEGFVTLHHVIASTDYQMQVFSVPAQTPSIDNDVFQGSLPLAGLPNGVFEIRGRARDTLGNKAIMHAVASPDGDETIRSGDNLKLDLQDGEAVEDVYLLDCPTPLVFTSNESVNAQWGGTADAHATQDLTFDVSTGVYKDE